MTISPKLKKWVIPAAVIGAIIVVLYFVLKKAVSNSSSSDSGGYAGVLPVYVGGGGGSVSTSSGFIPAQQQTINIPAATSVDNSPSITVSPATSGSGVPGGTPVDYHGTTNIHPAANGDYVDPSGNLITMGSQGNPVDFAQTLDPNFLGAYNQSTAGNGEVLRTLTPEAQLQKDVAGIEQNPNQFASRDAAVASLSNFGFDPTLTSKYQGILGSWLTAKGAEIQQVYQVSADNPALAPYMSAPVTTAHG